MVAQVQVTVPLTATVSTAGLDDPFSPLLKKMSPTVTAAVVGAGPVGAGLAGLAGAVGLAGVVGLVGLVVVVSSLQPASTPAVNKPLTSSIM
ncbi:MAG TPA: hypothetical protein VE091_01150 [Gemmatimonadales bacterium]|nr:hypothetical protein [Gemmatimonadales bacterium]